ncbi:T9SS C-terminal target domain-containing protein [Chryseobacterium nakagawai]|uniref:T9SS C-terminal target domain-containing protein n=1 Tax=Chryseobacterium nakagawai TaxID=1241982 RepID=A0AAD1DT44_CHRNA|nr:T9SS type A sorting domain-containing protein [Chryseobacterium nakagawai]AZA93170.1 T9SS C-terminal target domain-containing protein [Chryseobacterium nakagawai]
MKRILLMCMMALGIGASAQILVNEGFEGGSLSPGWTSSALPTTASQTPSIGMWSSGTACAGSNMAYRNLYSSVTSYNLVYSSLNSNGLALDYSFQYAAKGYSSTASTKGNFTAEYSLDGGGNWTTLVAPVNLDSPGTTPISCTTVSGTIPAGTIPAGADFKFRITANYVSPGDFYLGFDEIKLSQPITTPPGCTTLVAPAAAATGVSRTPTLKWNSAAGATGYLINIGTTQGGNDVLNNVNVGNTLSYTLPAANTLNYSTTYFVKVIPTNDLGSNTGCSESSFTTLNIGCPTVSAPSSAATGVSVLPAITWSSVSGATGYKISIGSTTGGTDIMNNVDVGNVTTYTLTTPLLFNTKYYYTVNSYSPTSVSSGCTERTFTTATLCPSVSAPSAAATSVSVLPTFTWTAIAGVTGYRITIGTTTGGNDIMDNFDVGNVATYTLTTPLAFNTKYYYKVIAYSGSTVGTACSERTFTTAVLCPSVSAPSSAATGVSVLPTFTWTAIAGVTGYRITMGTTAGGNDIMDNFDVGNVATYTLTTPLAFNTKYYYKVIAYSGSTVGTACAERTFTTSTLCPVVTAPSSSATGVSVLPTFTWDAITGATGYKISMGTTSGGVDILNNVDVGNVTTYVLTTPLAFSTKYYYTVTGYAGGLTGSSCTVRNFTTQGACPSVTYPADLSAIQPLKPTFKWSPIVTATSYTLTIGTTAGGSDIMNNVDVGNVTSYTLTTALTQGTKYYYKVNTTTSTGCTERSFTVNATPAPANDDCVGSLVASSLPYTYSQTDGAGSTNGTGFITACSSSSNDGMWFKFTGNGNEITVAAKNTTAWDHKVSVYSGSCGALTCVGTADAVFSSVGSTETYTFNSVAGTVYYVNVGYYSSTIDNPEGNFDLNITSSSLSTSEVVSEKVKEIKVYPNPFTDTLNISDISKVQSVSVIDLAGRVVKTIEKPSSELQLTDLKQGMYLIVLHLKDGSKQVVKSIKR